MTQINSQQFKLLVCQRPIPPPPPRGTARLSRSASRREHPPRPDTDGARQCDSDELEAPALDVAPAAKFEPTSRQGFAALFRGNQKGDI